ncbi:MAG: hypothetical protein V4451_12380 [Pseudomonadota bacterium]
MDLARFHRAIDVIDKEVKSIGIQNHLAQLVQDLNNIAANPGNEELSKLFKDHLDQLRELLLNSELTDAEDDDLFQVIANLDLYEYVGEGLLEKVLETFQSNQLSAQLASSQLTALRNDVVKKLDQIASINSAFTDLDIEYFSLDEGKGEMVVDMPIEEETKTLEDLSKEAKEWHRICDAISETFDPDRTPVTIRTLATGSWLLYLAGTSAFIYGVAKCMKGVNTILAELIKMQSLYSELVANKTPSDILKKLDAHNSTRVKTDLDSLATSLVKEFYKGNDEGRKSELRNALSASLQRLSRKLAEGTKVQLRLTLPKDPEIADGQEATTEQKKQLRAIAESKKVQAAIEDARPLTDFEEHRSELQKGLPAPTTDSSKEAN